MKNSKKIFEIPEIELIELEIADIVLASNGKIPMDDGEGGINLPIIPIG